jgi:hypothetical protein
MPRRVADQYSWRVQRRSSALGKARSPGDLIGTCRQLPHHCARGIDRVYRKSKLGLPTNGTRETGLASALLFPSFVMTRNRRSLPHAAPQWVHHFRTNPFGVSAPMASPAKTGATHSPATGRERGSRLHFEWIANGLTAVSFWAAPGRCIPGLEGRRGWRVKGTTLPPTRSSPNRCLAELR